MNIFSNISQILVEIFCRHGIKGPPWPSDYDAWHSSVRSHVQTSSGSLQVGSPGRYKGVCLCGDLSFVLLQLTDYL